MSTKYRNAGHYFKLELLGQWKDVKKYGHLSYVSGFESISQLYCYELELITDNQAIMKEVFCNKPISFSIEENYSADPKKTMRKLHGLITEVTFSRILDIPLAAAAQRPAFRYRLTVQPNLYKLTLAKNARVFYDEKKNALDVITEVLEEYDIQNEVSVKKDKLLDAETYIQYNESDFDFISRLMQSAGIFYFFKQQDDKEVLVLSNQASAYAALQVTAKVQFAVAQGFHSIHDIGFNYAAYTSDFIVKAFAYEKPEEFVEKNYSNAVHSAQQKSSAKSQEVVYLGTIKDKSKVTQLAENMGINEQGKSIQISGSSSYSDFIVGGKFELDDPLFKDLTQKKYVLSTLKFSARDHREWDAKHSSQAQYENSFVAIQDNHYLLPDRSVKKPIMSGLHFAVIVDKEGKSSSETPYCDDKGYVFIKLLWSADTKTCKANVLSASNSFALPRIGSVAYVLFPENSLSSDTPVVVGIHNEGLMKFADKEDWYKNIHMVYPATSDKEIYNHITFKDKKDEQEIKVLARKDMNIEVEHDEIVSIKNDSTKTVKEGNILVTAEKKDITTIAKEGEIVVTAEKKDIKTTAKEGQIIVLAEKGDISTTANKGKIETTADKGDIIINAKGGMISISAKGDISFETKGDFKVNAQGAIILQSKSEVQVKAMRDITLDAKQNVSIKAALGATYQAGTTVSIKGQVKVSIEGTMIEVKGNAMNKISAPMVKIGM